MSIPKRNLKTNSEAFFPNYLCYLYSTHSTKTTHAQQKKKLGSKCVCHFLPWEPLFIQVFIPPFIDGIETPHQPSLCSVIHISIKEPLHPQQRIHSITELKSVVPLSWKTKRQKHITYKPTKTTKCKKE
jgi:hypothetical protein